MAKDRNEIWEKDNDCEKRERSRICVMKEGKNISEKGAERRGRLGRTKQALLTVLPCVFFCLFLPFFFSFAFLLCQEATKKDSM